MGVDPGLIKTGIGVIRTDGCKSHLLYYGTIAPRTNAAITERLDYLDQQFMLALERHQPDQIAIEDIFLGQNFQSALKLGYARGICLLKSYQYCKQVFSYSARDIKLSVVGSGSANKEQVQYMIKLLLNTTSNISADESDALAAGLCHAHRQSNNFKC